MDESRGGKSPHPSLGLWKAVEIPLSLSRKPKPLIWIKTKQGSDTGVSFESLTRTNWLGGAGHNHPAGARAHGVIR